MAAETPAENTEGKKKLLVVGKPDAVPETLRCGAALLGLDDYEKNRNILRYDAVCVTKLTLSQLADAALGKPDSPAACALVYALLENVPVTMLESALPHKKYAGRQSAALYELYETYARSLQIFGVKLLRPQAAQTQTPAKPPKFCPAPVPAPQTHGAPNPERVITEDMTQFAASVAEAFGTEAPKNAGPAIPAVGAMAKDAFGGPADRLLIYNPDCLGLWFWQKYTDRYLPVMALINLLTDIIYAYCDPRIKAQYSSKG